MKKTKLIFSAVFITWTLVWMLFLVRGIIKEDAEDFMNLFGKTLEEKRLYVTGREFYEFIVFCRAVIPDDADYTVEAVYDDSMDYFRFAYYMLPALRDTQDPDYIACYKTGFNKKGYDYAASMGDDKYILRKADR